MMLKSIAIAAACLLAPVGADAAVISDGYRLIGSGFAADAPIQQVIADVYLDFEIDNGNYDFSRDGITTYSLDVPDAQPLGVRAGYSAVGPFFDIRTADPSSPNMFQAFFIDSHGSFNGLQIVPEYLSYTIGGVNYVAGTFRIDRIGRMQAVPEAATWAMFIGGFGLVGGAMRRRGRSTAAAPAMAATDPI